MGFFDELSERHVVRAVGYYVVAAFALWQAADIAIPALGLPESWMTAIVAGAIAGLPIVAVLSWLYDLNRTADGRPRSRTVRIASVVAGVLVVALLVGGLVHRLRRSGAAGDAARLDGPVSIEIGVERYFAGEWATAIAILEAVAADAKTPRNERVEALRYAVRASSESGDSASARDAMRRLLDMEPPLVLMLPGVETAPVMDLYYAARQQRLVREPPVAVPVRAVAVFDFNVLGDPPAGTTTEDWRPFGRGAGGILLNELSSRAGPDVMFVDRYALGQGRGFDVYRYIDSPEASGVIEATHLVIGSVAARSDQILFSAWLIDANDGTLKAKSQRLGRLQNLDTVLENVADDLARAMRPPADSAGPRG
ncbi:MAG: hypothetical protein PVH00_15420 [Gemmatimonadota bacterium]|jgi:uncharacterized membrane protein